MSSHTINKHTQMSAEDEGQLHFYDDQWQAAPIATDGSFLSPDEVTDKDWMELTWRLAHHHPDEFFHVFQNLSGRARAAEVESLKSSGGNAGSGPGAGDDEDGFDAALKGAKPARGQGGARPPAEESAL